MAAPEDAQGVTYGIRGLLGELRGEDFVSAVCVLYSGSVKPGNVAEVVPKRAWTAASRWRFAGGGVLRRVSQRRREREERLTLSIAKIMLK